MSVPDDEEPEDYFVYIAKKAYRASVRAAKRPVEQWRAHQEKKRLEVTRIAAKRAQEAQIKADLATESAKQRRPIVFKSHDTIEASPAPTVPDDSPIRCPKCGSSQLSSNKKGFNVGQGAVGCLLIGPVGLTGGLIGSSKIKITCLKCGCVFDPGQGK